MPDEPANPPKAAVYPAFVGPSEEERHRYDLALAVAADLMQEPPESKHSRFAAARLYQSDAPT